MKEGKCVRPLVASGTVLYAECGAESEKSQQMTCYSRDKSVVITNASSRQLSI